MILPAVVAPSPAKPHVPALDGLRGCAVLLVMTFHYAGSLDVLGAARAGTMPFRLGWMGVDVFFALSGFLITGILLDAKGSPAFFRNFYIRRVLRIAPLYYAAILVAAVLQLSIGPDHAWGNTDGVLAPGSMLWPLTYLENLALCLEGPFNTGILRHYWSLAVEEHFYLVWPLLVWSYSRRCLAQIAGAAVAGSMILRAAAAAAGADPTWIMGLTPLRVDGLALGALAALLCRSRLDDAARARLAWVVLAGAVVGTAALVVHRRTLSQFDPVLWVFAYPLAAAASAAVIVLASRPGLLMTVLDNKLLRWFGRYSFGLYVWHPIIAVVLLHSHWSLVRPGASAAVIGLATVGTFVLTLAWSWLSFRYVEQPFLALKRYVPLTRTMSASMPTMP